MMLKVRILPRAEYDAQAIFEYIASRSPGGALRWWQAFEEATSKIEDAVDQFGLAPENGRLNFELRQYLFKSPQGGSIGVSSS